MTEKKCSQCGETKAADQFYRQASSASGLQSKCKPCCLSFNKKYCESNKESRLAKQRKTSKLYYNKYKEECKKSVKKWADSNKSKVNEYKKKHHKKKKAKDILYKLKCDIRRTICDAFRKKSIKKSGKTFSIIGCNVSELKQHIENQFKPGMSWSNRSEWHIDHIIPLAIAKTEEDIIKLNHYTNLRPLWASENLSKGAKLPADYDKHTN